MNKNFSWARKGLIFSPDRQLEWSKNYAQIPTAFLLNEKIIRIFYASRDSFNVSRVGFVDVEKNNPQKIVFNSPVPILDTGDYGAFDDAGVMPSSIIKYKKKLYLFFIGWSNRISVPYHTAIGLAISENNGETFKKAYEGPIMDRTHLEPHLCSTPYVIVEGNNWRNWYLSGTEWVSNDLQIEPKYNIKYAESSDGISWLRKPHIAIDFKTKVEGGISRPSILKMNENYMMWYSYRAIFDYRTNTKNAYKIGYAVSINGINWTRIDNKNCLKMTTGEWDSTMAAYPNVIRVDNKLLMFYNGNFFGKDGFGFAEAYI